MLKDFIDRLYIIFFTESYFLTNVQVCELASECLINLLLRSSTSNLNLNCHLETNAVLFFFQVPQNRGIFRTIIEIQKEPLHSNLKQTNYNFF